MKSKILPIVTIILILFLSILAFNYLKSRNRLSDTNKNSQPFQNLTAEEISLLDNGVIVRFPATLGRRFESNCIELFVQDDFKKYNGDGKFAIFSRFAFETRPADLFGGSNNPVVTGRMIFVRDSTDIRNTCGIVTGQLFEITEIEYF